MFRSTLHHFSQQVTNRDVLISNLWSYLCTVRPLSTARPTCNSVSNSVPVDHVLKLIANLAQILWVYWLMKTSQQLTNLVQ